MEANLKNSLDFDKDQSENTKNLRKKHEKEFSFFKKPVKNIIPAYSITLEILHQLISSDILKSITEDYRAISDIKESKNYKSKNFDYVTPNGIFKKRNEGDIIQPSGYFVIDIDQQEDLVSIKNRLIIDNVLKPALIFTSPSNNGLKVFINIDLSVIKFNHSEKKMANIWEGINGYFTQTYSDCIKPDVKGNYIDPSGKDLSRACFICHDHKAYINLNSEILLGEDFINKYKVSSDENKHQNKQTNKKVSPRTTLQDLAKRHLKDQDNHHPELLAFIGAAKNIGSDIETLLQFIKEYVKISTESAHIDSNKLEELINDIYNRYPQGSEGVIPLTPLSFAFGILQFKFSKDYGGYVLSGLYYEGIRQCLHKAGFAKRYIGKNAIFIRQNERFISEASTQQMRDVLTEYVESFKANLSFKYKEFEYRIPYEAIRETYLKNSNNIFNNFWLEHLRTHTTPVLKDTTTKIFLPFKNVLVKITKEGIETIDWNNVQGYCVWEEQLIPHDFKYIQENDTCEFGKFLRNVTNHDQARFTSVCTAIGYLTHHHFRESEGQAVVFYDEAITDTKNPQGRTGKGLIANALKQIRNITKIDGKHLESTNKFRWELIQPSTQIVWLDDTKPDFDFSLLHSNLTDGWTIERKFLSQIIIPPKDSPKTLLCSNSIIKGGGSTNIGRQFHIELSNHYSKKIIIGNEKPIEEEHGGLFFSNESWSEGEWLKFFSFMCDCAYHYLNRGLVPYKTINIEKNRFRQETNDDFADWCEQQKFDLGKRYKTTDYFEKFKGQYYGENSTFFQRAFTNWIKSFAKYKGWECELGQSNGPSYFAFIEKK